MGQNRRQPPICVEAAQRLPRSKSEVTSDRRLRRRARCSSRTAALPLMDMRVVAVARLSRGVMAACALQATFCRCAGKPRSLSAQWRRVSMQSTMPDPAGLGPRVVARTPRCVRSLRWASTKTPSSPLTGTDFTFPSPLLVPTVRAQVDSDERIFGSRTSVYRYARGLCELSRPDAHRRSQRASPSHRREHRTARI